VSTWCRQLGADVTYATYYGQRDPRSLLPADLDIAFISTYTHASAAAYALAKLLRRDGVLTVIGGPHARSYPTDCLRFFDLVVHQCDKQTIEDILKGAFDPGSLVSAASALVDIPSVEERLPEILISSLTSGRHPLGANVPLLSSVGCPYTCNFCLDWNNPYSSIAPERLVRDLRFISDRFPGTIVSFHDHNFGVNFDQKLSAMETIPEGRRNPYFMESSLSILKPARLERLRATNCHYVAPGVESWADYSNKAGVGLQTGRQKLDGVVAQFLELGEFVPNMQANFIFGTDLDAGDEPVELTQEFIRRVPRAWPVINIPTPFGGTPLHDHQLAEGRILATLPFSFYYMPHLVMTLRNYSPLEYYDRIIRIQESLAAWSSLPARGMRAPSPKMAIVNVLRGFAANGVLSRLKAMRSRLRDDAGLLRFHEGRVTKLPTYYRETYRRRLGRYAELLSASDSTPIMEAPAPAPAALGPLAHASVPRLASTPLVPRLASPD
jgi:radical SAM superfamily enzyme YgiQ (UPF0313 family)